MTTPSTHWPVIKALFEATAELTAAERAPLIAAAALHADAHAELLSLLHHHDQADGSAAFLAEPAALALAGSAARTGQRLGAWEIVRAVGSGGMGEVFEARRADGQYDGRAAVKLLKRGMDSAAVLQRFAQERQALARLTHPHIARLLDAGASDDGLPYFVLEFVDGRPIDEAVRGLPLERRLHLFLQLADAVVHAHRNLLVHRDLKPGNVMVDSEGRVKLLDFGIAKALDPLEGQGGDTTVAGLRPYTPHYASPEQVRGEPVSTATDIYSLGVLLYQMLTGARPTGRHANTPAEAARSVLEEQPTRPSRLTASEALDPQWLSTRKRLEGDLDNILLKALEKAPEQRYGSVEALAGDVQAFIDGRPVAARAASPAYVLGKFVRRHRWAMLAAGLGGLGLVMGLAAALVQGRMAVAVGATGLTGGLVFALVQAQQALRSRALAESMRQRAEARFADLRGLARNVLFDYHALVEPLVGSTPVRRRLVSDALQYLERMQRDLPGDRGVQLEVGMAWLAVGMVQRNGYWRPHLGDTESALRSHDRAIATLDGLVREDESDDHAAFELARALCATAALVAEDGDMARAEPLYARAAALHTAHLHADASPALRHRLELARTHLHRAASLSVNRLHDAARAAIQVGRGTLQSLEDLQPTHAELPRVKVWLLFLDAQVGRGLGEWRAVEHAMLQNEAGLSALLATDPDSRPLLEDHASTASMLLTAGEKLRDTQAVRRWGGEAVRRWERVTRHDPQDLNSVARHLDVVIDHGRALAAVDALDEGLAVLRAARRPIADACAAHPGDAALGDRPALLESTLADLLWRAGRHDEAQVAFDEADKLAQAWVDARPELPEAATCKAVIAWRRTRSLAQQALQAGDLPAARREVPAMQAALQALELLRDTQRLLPVRRAQYIDDGRDMLARVLALGEGSPGRLAG